MHCFQDGVQHSVWLIDLISAFDSYIVMVTTLDFELKNWSSSFGRVSTVAKKILPILVQLAQSAVL